MSITALEIKDKSFKNKFRGYHQDEVHEFLDIVADDFEQLVKENHEKDNKIKALEDKISYYDEMRESLSQSVILAQETAEKVKESANEDASHIMNKANFDSQQLLEEAKNKANQILREATDEAKRVAVETEDLKRRTRVFHQRLTSAVEGQLSLVNSSEWNELLQPTAVYLQNSDAAFKEVVEKVLDEQVLTNDDTLSLDATRQFTPDEMAELQRLVEESNRQLEESQKVIIEAKNDNDNALGETQTFKLNITE